MAEIEIKDTKYWGELKLEEKVERLAMVLFKMANDNCNFQKEKLVYYHLLQRKNVLDIKPSDGFNISTIDKEK